MPRRELVLSETERQALIQLRIRFIWGTVRPRPPSRRLRRPRPAPARIGEPCARQTPPLKSGTRRPAQGAVHARHGYLAQDRLGSGLPGSPRRRRQGPHGHHRRHDAQTRSCRLRRPQIGTTLQSSSSWCLTTITVSTVCFPGRHSPLYSIS